MIPPLPVQPLPLDDAAVRRPVAEDVVTGNGMAFVTILSVLAVRDDDAAQPPVLTNAAVLIPQQARIFNQDGFFGSATAGPVGIVTGPGITTPIQGSLTEPAATAIDRVSPPASFVSPARTSVRTDAAPAAPVALPGAQASTPVPQRSVGDVPRPRLRPDRPAPVVAPIRRERPLPTAPAMTAPVAVALHATQHGLEIVARLAATDPGDRRQLADEIAALLSAHGYPPGRIVVLAPAAPTSARKDR